MNATQAFLPSQGTPLKTRKCLLPFKMQIIIKSTFLTNCNNVLYRTIVFSVLNESVQHTSGETDKQSTPTVHWPVEVSS